MTELRPLPRAAEPHDGPAALLPAAFLALGTFAIGTEGYMIAPLLPRIAADLGVPTPLAAALVILFTLTLALTSPVTTALTRRFNRRDVALAAIGLFTLANLAAASTAHFSGLIAGRLVMAVAAGLYTPIANAVAGSVVPPAWRGRSLAIVSGGLTLAIALGLPLGSVVGQVFGWRATFLVVAGLGAIAFSGILAGIGRTSVGSVPTTGLAGSLAVAANDVLRRRLTVTFAWAVGAYATYPYVAVYLGHVVGLGPVAIAASVSLWGVSAAVGVALGGALSDRLGWRRVVAGSLALLALAFVVLALSAGLPPRLAVIPVLASITLWGLTVWSFYPAQISGLIGAVAAPEATVAVALNTSVMYLGFSLGSTAGALVVGGDLYWAIGALAATAEVLALLLLRRTHD